MRDEAGLRVDVVGVTVTCSTCHRVKKPVGRDAPFGSDHCDDQCGGYRRAPYPGGLWPGETEVDFGYGVSLDGTNQAERRP